MVRLCWVKGLLGAFDYVQFIKEHNCSGKIIDIYGKEHDIRIDVLKGFLCIAADETDTILVAEKSTRGDDLYRRIGQQHHDLYVVRHNRQGTALHQLAGKIKCGG